MKKESLAVAILALVVGIFACSPKEAPESEKASAPGVAGGGEAAAGGVEAVSGGAGAVVGSAEATAPTEPAGGSVAAGSAAGGAPVAANEFGKGTLEVGAAPSGSDYLEAEERPAEKKVEAVAGDRRDGLVSDRTAVGMVGSDAGGTISGRAQGMDAERRAKIAQAVAAQGWPASGEFGKVDSKLLQEAFTEGAPGGLAGVGGVGSGVGGGGAAIGAAGLRSKGALSARLLANAQPGPGLTGVGDQRVVEHNTEEYALVTENEFKGALENPLSTFSIDVDTASYANVRRFLNSSQLPPADAVRIEELINYFSYDYEAPMAGEPFSVNTELATCPWNPGHELLLIGLQGRELELEKLPPANLVFLLDVSGSMNMADKLPLLKKALGLLVEQLRPEDRVAVVVYAGAAGLVLPSTPGSEKAKILEALDGLQAGGSTAGGAGIELAYKVAGENRTEGSNSRVILATDGDFNVGVSSTGALTRLVEEKRKEGIFLTVLGFGRGNYKDGRMEQLADKGNGNYAYIDNILEARKVLVTQMGGTLVTIAKDVKLQLEFNPARVKEYRLIGYENRVLAKEDFNDDKKDAGELGSGHRVTALYEIMRVTGEVAGSADELKYSKAQLLPEAFKSDELLTVKLRYKAPDQDVSQLISKPVTDKATAISESSTNLRFAAGVALFGMVLRQSRFKGEAGCDQVVELARSALGKDEMGYRAEFLQMVEKARLLGAGKAGQVSDGR